MEAVSNHGHDNSFGRRACLWSGGGTFGAGCTSACRACGFRSSRVCRACRSGRATCHTRACRACRRRCGARGRATRTNSEARSSAYARTGSEG